MSYTKTATPDTGERTMSNTYTAHIGPHAITILATSDRSALPTEFAVVETAPQAMGFGTFTAPDVAEKLATEGFEIAGDMTFTVEDAALRIAVPVRLIPWGVYGDHLRAVASK